jgi:hypothetical protein
MPSAGEELTSGVVFRFGVRSPDEMFYSDRRKPLVGDFDLGSLEQTEAKRTHTASLSAWDEALTTVEQAQAFINPQRRLPIWLSVADIRALPHDLHVQRSPHEKNLPGREGHCDVGNVWSDDKITLKRIRSDLRDIATCERDTLQRSMGAVRRLTK